MRGMQAIVQQYQLAANADQDHGAYQWQRRMGVHLAFHQDPTNIFIHAIFSIINAWAVLLMAYPFKLFGLTVLGIPLDMAVLTLVGMFVIYARMDFGGALVTIFLFSLSYPFCEPVSVLLEGSALAMILLGIILTVLSLAIQVFIGHGIAEGGIDDAMENFAETFETKNPLYIALLPFYTYLDLMFRVGYRPGMASSINEMTEELRPKLVAEKVGVRS